jgi:general secretion pathway protein C
MQSLKFTIREKKYAQRLKQIKFALVVAYMNEVVKKLQIVPKQSIAKGLLVIFGLLAAIELAQMTWLLLPRPSVSLIWTPQIGETHSSTKIDIASLQASFFFGKFIGELEPVTADEEKTTEFSDAPETSLMITLKGVLAATTPRTGYAIIESGGQQSLYAVGDVIDNTSAKLDQVFVDRIIIGYQNRLETVMLEGLNYSNQVETGVQKSQPKKQVKSTGIKKVFNQDQKFKQRLQQKRAALLKSPKNMAEFLSISPVRKQGKLMGYRLNPMKDRKLFMDAGFRPNDLAKSINGYDLTDISQSMEFMKQLRDLKELSVVVERNNELIEVTLNLK